MGNTRLLTLPPDSFDEGVQDLGQVVQDLGQWVRGTVGMCRLRASQLPVVPARLTTDRFRTSRGRWRPQRGSWLIVCASCTFLANWSQFERPGVAGVASVPRLWTLVSEEDLQAEN